MTNEAKKRSDEVLRYLLEEMVNTMEVAKLDADEIVESIKKLPRIDRKMMMDIAQILGYDTLLESLSIADKILTQKLIRDYQTALTSNREQKFLSNLSLSDRTFLTKRNKQEKNLERVKLKKLSFEK